MIGNCADCINNAISDRGTRRRIVSESESNYNCRTILNMLKFQDFIENITMINRIAIIISTTKKSSCNSFVNYKIHIGEYDEYHEYDNMQYNV